MTKTNPLFVDSTKFQGDLIATQFELKGLVVYDTEALYVVVTNEQGIAMRVQMKSMEKDGYEARVHLNLQTPITYQFVIEKEGRRILQSIPQKARVQYALVEDWRPVLADPNEPAWAESIQGAPVQVTQGPPSVATLSQGRRGNVAWARESSMSVRSLIEKWGL